MLDKAFLSRPVLEAVQQIKSLAEEAGLTLAQFALAWALCEPNVTICHHRCDPRGADRCERRRLGVRYREDKVVRRRHQVRRSGRPRR